MGERRVAVEGSAPTHPPAAQRLATLAPDTQITASIILRRRPAEMDISKQLFSPNFQPISRDDAAAQLGADPSDVGEVEDFARDSGFHVISADAVTRTVKVQGAAADFEQAFGIQLSWYAGEDGQRYISYDGELTAPQPVAGAIIAVTGLDNRPVARSRPAEMEA